ncbi:MAG TPA: hypothetical protein VF515_14185 [Candidatus Binatia bacterium]
MITFFGVARGDDTLVDPIGVADDGPIYERPAYDFKLVVEGRPGGTLVPLGESTFSGNPAALPDLQVEASNNLGDGSPAVCDAGGVPAVNPFDFSAAQAPTINDFACRFKDGQGAPLGITNPALACTVPSQSGTSSFVDRSSKIQFCGLIDKPFSFPVGDTVVGARIRDTAGNVSRLATIVIRVLPP